MTERFEIQLSHACNNRCVFCVSGQMTELKRVGRTRFEEIEQRLTDARQSGAREATIIGGEPTIQSVFFPVLRHAVDLGFEDIVVFTNGARLHRKDFIDRVLALRDDFTWRISIQGWDEETHDATTKKKGAFAKIVAGLEYLTEKGQRITCNMCVVEQNYRSLSKLPDLLARYPISQVHLDMVRPRDSGERSEDYLDSIMPDYPDLSRVLGDMFERVWAINPDFDLTVGNLPFCQLPEWAHRIHHGGSTTLTVSAEGGGGLSVPWDKYEDKRTDKWKLDSCSGCLFDRSCDGFFDLYARRRGTDAFRPVSSAELCARDPEQRAFAYLIGASLRAVDAPAGFVLKEIQDSTREGWVRATYESARSSVRLLFLPAKTAGEGDGVHEQFLLRVEQAIGDRGEVATVVGHLFDALAARLPGDVRRRPTDVAPRLAVFGEGSDVPTPIQRVIRRVLDAAPFSGWRVADTWAHAEAPGVSLEFAGPRRDSARLELAPRSGKLSARWEFRGRGDDTSRRHVAHAVNALLRGATG